MNESRSFSDLFRTGALSRTPLIDHRDTHHLARREDFRLGNARIRPSIRTVEGPAGKVAAEPRVMQVLLALADAAGAVVTREDLIHRCWKDQVVGDDAVNRAIKEVRRVVRECGAGFTIETIPRIGYRLDRHELPGDLASPPPVEPAGNEAVGQSALSRRGMIVAGSSGLAVLAGGLAWFGSRPVSMDPVERLMEQSQVAMRAGTPAQEQTALALLEQAVEQDPGRAEAWGLLALTRARVDEHVIDDTATPLHAVDVAANRALQLDPDNADARAALVIAIPYYGDWLAADRRFAEFIGRHPEHLYARDAQSFFLGAVGLMRLSAQARLALRDRAPLDANLHYRTVYGHWFAGEIDEADRASVRGLEMWPRHAAHWFARLWILTGSGRVDRALAHLDDRSSRPPIPDEMFETLLLALTAVESGDSGQTRAAVSRILAGVRGSVTAVINALMLLNLLGALDEAFELSEAYYLENGPIIAAMQWRPGQPVVPDQRRRKTNMLFTPIMERMRKDARFLPLMERMGLVRFWDQRAVMPDFLR